MGTSTATPTACRLQRHTSQSFRRATLWSWNDRLKSAPQRVGWHFRPHHHCTRRYWDQELATTFGLLRGLMTTTLPLSTAAASHSLPFLRSARGTNSGSDPDAIRNHASSSINSTEASRDSSSKPPITPWPKQRQIIKGCQRLKEG